MGELGSIFEPQGEADGKKRGPDLRIKVKVPRIALGHPDGFIADVPESLEHDGGSIKRVVQPADRGVGLPLFLPPNLPEGAMLRLRGQGGVIEDGVPGDLLVQIIVVEPPPPRVPWLAIAAAAAAATGLLTYLLSL